MAKEVLETVGDKCKRKSFERTLEINYRSKEILSNQDIEEH